MFYCLHCAYTETGWKGEEMYVVDFGGPCRGRTYGPLIKSHAESLSQHTQQDKSSAKEEGS